MRFSCSLPIEGSFQSVEAIADAARAIETAGVDACFVTDHPAPSAEWLSQPQNGAHETGVDRKSTRLNSSHITKSYAVLCLKKKHKRAQQRDNQIDQHADENLNIRINRR